jgi:TRAP transporter TAXI family solute receptor
VRVLRNYLFLVFLGIVYQGNAVYGLDTSDNNAHSPEQQAHFDPSESLILIATGSQYGLYNPISRNICRLIKHSIHNLNLHCNTKTLTNSFRILEYLKDAKVEFAILQADIAKYGFYGFESSQKIEPNNNLRFVMSLHTEDLILLVRRDAGINSLEDIRGKVIGYHDAMSKTGKINTIMDAILSVKNINLPESNMVPLALEDQASSLCNKKIDVLSVMAGYQSNVISEAARSCEVSLVEIDDPTIDVLRQKYTDFFQDVTTYGYYPGINKKNKTVGVKAVLVSSTAVSDEVVYAVTKAIMENIENFKKVDPNLADLELRKMANEGRNIEIHTGAARYYREKGYIID